MCRTSFQLKRRLTSPLSLTHRLSYPHATADISVRDSFQSCPELDDNANVLRAVGASRDLPVLVLWGTADKTVTREAIDAVMGMLPQGKLRVFEGQGHSFLVTEPQTNAEVIQFLSVDK